MGWGQVQMQDTPDGFRLEWGAPGDARLGNSTVLLNAALVPERNAVHWSLEVKTAGTEWGVWRVIFPQVSLCKFDERAVVLVPSGPGELKHGAWDEAYVYDQPYGQAWCTMQLMAAYAEGLGVLRNANVGKKEHAADAETTPLRDPEHYQYDLNLRDIAEVWRRGSVIASWLLDLTAAALVEDPALAKFAGRVSDSGEGRWTIKAAVDEAVPVPVLATALYERFTSRGEADFQDKLLSAMRFEFGGHLEKSAV